MKYLLDFDPVKICSPQELSMKIEQLLWLYSKKGKVFDNEFLILEEFFNKEENKFLIENIHTKSTFTTTNLTQSSRSFINVIFFFLIFFLDEN